MEFTESWKWLKLGTFITHNKQLLLLGHNLNCSSNQYHLFGILAHQALVAYLAISISRTLQFRGHVSKQTTQPLIPNTGPSTNVRSERLRWTLTTGLTSAVCKRGMRKARAVILSYAFSDQPNPTGCLSVSDEPNPISAPSSMQSSARESFHYNCVCVYLCTVINLYNNILFSYLFCFLIIHILFFFSV